MGVSKLGYPKMDGFIVESPIKMDDLGIYIFFHHWKLMMSRHPFDGF